MAFYIVLTCLLYVAIACAIVFSVIANAHVLPEKKNWRQPFFWREKDDFTSKGWKFKQASVCLGVIAFALIPLSKIVQFLEIH